MADGMATRYDPDPATLDAADPLAAFRDRFVFSDPGLVYLDGNSLGRVARARVRRLAGVVGEEGGGELIRGWDHWLDEPRRVGDLLATEILGARTGEVIVSDSTTVNFYKLARAALAARQGRRIVVTDRANFPTDRYVLEGLAAGASAEIAWLDPDPVDGPQPDQVASILDANAGDAALVTLSHVNYRSAAIADMAAITRLAHDAGALILWDLSHSAGSIEVDLDGAGVDLAVGCTYKYLDGGPGAPAWLYVRKTLQAELRNPIQGWFGQRDQFAMGQGYEPRPDIGAWLTGSPPSSGCSRAEGSEWTASGTLPSGTPPSAVRLRWTSRSDPSSVGGADGAGRGSRFRQVWPWSGSRSPSPYGHRWSIRQPRTQPRASRSRQPRPHRPHRSPPRPLRGPSRRRPVERRSCH